MVGDILQPTHLLFILVIALLVLGPKRLPEVGRTLGSGLRDFRQAINGESAHEDRAPQAYVEPEPDPVPALGSDGTEAEPASFDAAAEQPATLDATTSDLPTVGDHLQASVATDDLQAPAATEQGDEPDADESDAVAAPVATASSSGFASALASSRQRPAGDGEPAADDE